MADDLTRRGQGTRMPAERMRDPFSSFRDEMDRLFETFLGGAGLPALTAGRGLASTGAPMMIPSMDVRETEKEVIIEADLPGIDEKDISLTMQNGVLTLRGEKKAETKEERENYHMMERSYGSFQRSVRLPDTIDEDNVDARFEKGVLKITLPKRPEAVKQQKKIEIKGAAA